MDEKTVNYTELLSRYCDVEKLKSHDKGLFEDIVETGFFRAGFTPEDVKDKEVIDLGAHIGVFSLTAIANGAKNVFSVEMNPTNYGHLVEFTKNINNIRCLNLAAFDGILKHVYFFDKGTLSKAAKTGNQENSIPAYSLEEILCFSRFSGNDLTLKMDIEGSEYDVLLSSPSHVLKRFSTIIMEVHPVRHDNGPGKNAKFLKEYLSYFGFEVVKCTPIFWLEWDPKGTQISCKPIEDLELVKFIRK